MIMRFIEKLIEKGDLYIEKLVMRFLASFFFVSGIFLFQISLTDPAVDFKSLDFVRESNIALIIPCIILGILLLTSLSLLIKQVLPSNKVNIDAYAMAVSLTGFAFLTLWKNDNFYYAFGIILVLSAMLYYLLKNGYLKEMARMNTSVSVMIIVAGAVIMCTFVAVLCVMRYKLYYASTFDLGIAGQMYYYMKETFQILTTCERDVLLSHFSVHFTPVYYLLLPVYYIFPYMETLLIAQPVLLAIGVIPLYLICRHRAYKPAETTCISLAYLFSMAIASPCFYDFHENAFIPALMLWFFYFLEKKKWTLMYVFLFLTMGCKEDVAISMACVGMFMFFSNKKDLKPKLHGAMVAVVSLCFFFIVTALLSKYGEGIFSHRFNSLMAEPDNGLSEIFRTMITNPGFIFSESFNADKFIFMMQLFLPLGFIPFLSKKGGHFLLLAPTFLVCMLPGYPYQHNIDFQYVHGMIPMLIYLVVLNAKGMGGKVRKYALPCIAVASIALTFSHLTPNTNWVRYYRENDREKLAAYETYLSRIPEEASVEATHIFVPRLSSRREIYMMPDTQENVIWEPTDYVVMKVGPGISEEDRQRVERKVEYLLENGYTYAFGDENHIAVYRKE